MGEIIDISGNKYGRLRVLGYDHSEGKRTYWKCLCDCNRIVVLRKDHFAYPYSRQKSCGCLHNEIAAARMREWHRQARLRKEGR